MELSYEQFQKCVDYLYVNSTRLGDGWQKLQSSRSEVYAVKECLVQVAVCAASSSSDGDDTFENSELSDEDDQSSLAAATTNADDMLSVATRRCIYHVVYSSSYRVPVLYFNMYSLDGKLLSLEDVWNAVPDHFQARLKDERWTFVTQQDHPHLGRPFFQLHPCKTASLMESLQCSSTSDHYVCSWLSAVGAVVGLSISSSYFLPVHGTAAKVTDENSASSDPP